MQELWHADFADLSRIGGAGGFKKNIVTMQLVLLSIGFSFSWSFGIDFTGFSQIKATNFG